MAANPLVFKVPQVLVCIIDADDGTQVCVNALLRRPGGAVRGYRCARDFLVTLGEAVPDCLIAAATMPDMDGIELLQELGRRGLAIPTILLAHQEDVPFAVAAMRAGAVDFVERPYIDRALLHHVGHLLTPDRH